MSVNRTMTVPPTEPVCPMSVLTLVIASVVARGPNVRRRAMWPIASARLACRAIPLSDAQRWAAWKMMIVAPGKSATMAAKDAFRSAGASPVHQELNVWPTTTRRIADVFRLLEEMARATVNYVSPQASL